MKINPLNFLVFAAVFFWCSASSASYFAAGMDGGVARFSSVEAKVQLQYLLEKGTESTPTSAPQTKRVTVPTGRASLKNLLKLKKLAGFSPLGIGLTAAGFLVDELGELVFSDPSVDPISSDGLWRVNNGGVATYSPSQSLSCEKWGPLRASNQYSRLQSGLCYSFFLSSGVETFGAASPMSFDTGADCSAAGYGVDDSGNCVIPAPSVPVPDQQFDDEILPKLDWPFIASNPDGSPVPTPELTASTDAVNNWYNNNYTQNTNTTNTTTTTATPTGSESTSDIEWPAFCGWASIMCDLANYIMESPAEPNVPDLPVENIVHEEVEWSSGLGAGTCPAPLVTSFMGHSIVQDWADECAAVTSIFRPILLFISLISAGFIVAGVRE